MYGLHTESKSSIQFWDLINKIGGKYELDARIHSIKEIVEGDLFRKVSESWVKDSIKDGKMDMGTV